MRPWEQFFRDKMIKIFNRGGMVIDVGGGLRVVKEKNNRYDPKREWLRPYLSKVDYKILDVVPTYHPDIVGDIHHLPFKDNSIDSVICIAVLQHVEEPAQAMKEIHRVLKPGGQAFIYVPFLYYYHAEKGYYKDYWRFTKDSLEYLSRAFGKIELQSIRGAVETWIKISPLGRFSFMNQIGYMLDLVFKKLKSNQVSGYNVFLTK
jgi:SAM-dependent methyltransferase